MPNPLGKYGDIMVKGLVGQAAPSIAQGVLIEMLKGKNLNVEMASQWVLENRSLWGELEPGEREGLKRLAARVSDLSWMNAGWAIDAMRRELPSVASLFLGWVKARNWLERQIDILKVKVRE